jgi:hypothetical protein
MTDELDDKPVETAVRVPPEQSPKSEHEVLRDFTFIHPDGSTLDFKKGEIFVSAPGEDVSGLIADGSLAPEKAAAAETADDKQPSEIERHSEIREGQTRNVEGVFGQ